MPQIYDPCTRNETRSQFCDKKDLPLRLGLSGQYGVMVETPSSETGVILVL